MTDCIACGECCDPFVIKYTKAELRRLNIGDALTATDVAFILEHMTQLSAKEGLHRAAHYNGRFDELGEKDRRTGEVTSVRGDRSVFYECSFFDNDPTSRTYRMCTAHDKRPPVCRGFPDGYKGGWPRLDKFLPIDCSYRQDQIDLLDKQNGKKIA